VHIEVEIRQTIWTIKRIVHWNDGNVPNYINNWNPVIKKSNKLNKIRIKELISHISNGKRLDSSKVTKMN